MTPEQIKNKQEIEEVLDEIRRKVLRNWSDIVPTRRCINETVEEVYLGSPEASDWYVTESTSEGKITIEKINPIIVEDKKDG